MSDPSYKEFQFQESETNRGATGIDATESTAIDSAAHSSL
jgi:2-succinyl-5-enolpyruvyl-6-hydroxy-3-cyclohexene-1-carboxylate synthase